MAGRRHRRAAAAFRATRRGRICRRAVDVPVARQRRRTFTVPGRHPRRLTTQKRRAVSVTLIVLSLSPRVLTYLALAGVLSLAACQGADQFFRDGGVHTAGVGGPLGVGGSGGGGVGVAGNGGP